MRHNSIPSQPKTRAHNDMKRLSRRFSKRVKEESDANDAESPGDTHAAETQPEVVDGVNFGNEVDTPLEVAEFLDVAEVDDQLSDDRKHGRSAGNPPAEQKEAPNAAEIEAKRVAANSWKQEREARVAKAALLTVR